MKQSKGFMKKIFIGFSIISIVFLAAAFIIYRISFIDLLKYLAFQVFYIALPGYLIYRVLRLKGDGVEKLTISYGLGVVFTIIQYYAFYFINVQVLLFIAGPLMSAVEITMLVKDRKKTAVPVEHLEIPYGMLILFIIVFMMMFVTFTLSNPLPSVIGSASYNQDLLWSIGNMQSHIRNIIPVDSRLSGLVFKYHYFMTLHLGVIGYVTKIDLAALYFQFANIGKLALLFFSLYILGKQVLNSSKKAIFFVFIYFFSSCASGIANLKHPYGLFLNVNFIHVVSSPMGNELALSLMCLTVVCILKQFKESKLNIGYLIAATLFLFAATGSKGPIGAMIAAVVVAVLIISIFQRKQSKILAIYCIILVLIFLTVYKLLLSTGDPTLGLSLGYTVRDTILGKYITGRMSLLVCIFLHFILFLPFAAPLFIIWMVQRLRNLKNTDSSQFLIGGLAICGIMATYLLKQDGHSELIFMMAAIPLIEICALQLIFDNYEKMKFIGKAVVVSLLVLSVSTTVFTLYNYGNTAFQIGRAVKTKAFYENEPVRNGITRYEYEGLNWIKNNTTQDAIICGDRYFYSDSKVDSEARFFYYSAFSERQFFLEGYYYHFKQGSPILDRKLQLMKEFYSGSESAFEALKKEHISYVIVSRIEHADLSLPYKGLDLKFKNRDIAIYEVK